MPTTPSPVDHARQMHEQLCAWRRHLHANPELSGQERQTAAYVAAALRGLGYEPRENVGGMFGVVAELRVNDGPFVALRADTDALPIVEETGLPFASKNPGVMHACGHDAHTAMLLGAAQLLRRRRDALKRNVRFLFQPHEEAHPGGAPAMIAGGALDNVESIFGLHIISTMPPGQVGSRPGPFMSGVTNIDIVIRGKGGHAAMPEACIDPIVISAALVQAMQTLVSRNIALTDEAVVSVTRVQGGTAYNIIPETVTLAGTIRTLDTRVRERVKERLTQLAHQVSAAHGGSAEVKLLDTYPPLVNDGPTLERALRAARDIGVPENQIATLAAQGGGEDFAYYGSKAPAAFVFLGAGNAQKGCIWPHHHPRFDIDEDLMPVGAALHVQYALSAGA